jgi:hypothetical protein
MDEIGPRVGWKLLCLLKDPLDHPPLLFTAGEFSKSALAQRARGPPFKSFSSIIWRGKSRVLSQFAKSTNVNRSVYGYPKLVYG